MKERVEILAVSVEGRDLQQMMIDRVKETYGIDVDYRMLTALDMPMIDVELIEVPATAGPYGARGVGEVPIVPPPAALANAIADAVGVRMRQLPMTPERVFWAMREGRGAAAT